MLGRGMQGAAERARAATNLVEGVVVRPVHADARAQQQVAGRARVRTQHLPPLPLRRPRLRRPPLLRRGDRV